MSGGLNSISKAFNLPSSQELVSLISQRGAKVGNLFLFAKSFLKIFLGLFLFPFTRGTLPTAAYRAFF
jgi:hypothetical protein